MAGICGTDVHQQYGELAIKGIRINCICPGPTIMIRTNEELSEMAMDII
jgi:hypothetical protein